MTTDVIIGYKSTFRPYIEYISMIVLAFLSIFLYWSYLMDGSNSVFYIIESWLTLNYIVYTLLNFLSNGKALGDWDRDIGILSGLLFWPLGIFVLFIGAILSFIYILLLSVYSFLRKEYVESKIIPFWPFLLWGIFFIIYLLHITI
jgi:hypothetical protein